MLEIIISPLSEEDGGGYIGTVPALPGCISDGETEAEATANTKDAIAEWLDEAAEVLLCERLKVAANSI